MHEPWCKSKALGHSDAAKRIADTYNLHRMAGGLGSVGKWFAAKLIDGRTDDTLYDNKRDAVTHQHHNEQWYTFVKINPSGMNACEAEVMLTVARSLYDKGLRLTDPDDRHGGKDIIRRLTVEDQRNLAMGTASNLIQPQER